MKNKLNCKSEFSEKRNSKPARKTATTKESFNFDSSNNIFSQDRDK